MTPVPILMYHSISDRPPRATAALAVAPEAFAEQLALLRDRGRTPLTIGELTTPDAEPPPGAVAITFDDGYADFHERALPVLADLGCPATLFVTTGWLADAGRHAAGRPLDRTLSWSQTREAAAAGVEIGGHGHSHPQLDQLSDADLREELRRSRALLEDNLGLPVHTMAYPYGYSSARVRRAVRSTGYRSACAVADLVATERHDLLGLPRLTVCATTSLERFGRMVDGTAGFRLAHARTRGYAVVRRSRYAVRRMLRDV